MLPEIQALLNELEDRKSELLLDLKTYSKNDLHYKPGPDRWSLTMVLQHIILGEKGVRLTEAELRHNPVRLQLRPGEMFDLVMDVLEKDIPVEVPDKFAEPDGSMGLEALISMWDHERQQLIDLLTGVTKKTLKDVMFSHAAAGPLDPIRTLKLAIAHFDTHRRQIDKIKSEIPAGAE